MTDNERTEFKDDGSMRIGNVRFFPVTAKDAEIALEGSSFNRHASYDIFNTNGDVFCGHVELYYDRSGYWRILEKWPDDGSNEIRIRIIDLPAVSLFDRKDLPKERKELTRAIFECTSELHNNKETGEWQVFDDPEMDLKPRVQFQRCLPAAGTIGDYFISDNTMQIPTLIDKNE